jgi:hypothetical protein
MWKKAFVALRYYPGNCLEGLRKSINQSVKLAVPGPVFELGAF